MKILKDKLVSVFQRYNVFKYDQEDILKELEPKTLKQFLEENKFQIGDSYVDFHENIWTLTFGSTPNILFLQCKNKDSVFSKVLLINDCMDILPNFLERKI